MLKVQWINYVLTPVSEVFDRQSHNLPTVLSNIKEDYFNWLMLKVFGCLIGVFNLFLYI